jgi:hypothetical protein
MVTGGSYTMENENVIIFLWNSQNHHLIVIYQVPISVIHIYLNIKDNIRLTGMILDYDYVFHIKENT